MGGLRISFSALENFSKKILTPAVTPLEIVFGNACNASI